jgi:hypothetical protein
MRLGYQNHVFTLRNAGGCVSRWTHSICDGCWKKRQEDQSIEALSMSIVDTHPLQICCFCEKRHNSGLSVRVDPEKTTCRGLHEDAAANI